MRKKILQMLMVLVLVIPITFAGFRSKSTVAGDAGATEGQALIIDPDAVSNVTLKSNYLDQRRAESSNFNGATHAGGQNGDGDYQTWDQWKGTRTTYMNFLDNAGMTGIGYTSLDAAWGGNGKTIDGEMLSLNYDDVGLAMKDGHYVTVGANITIDNIIFGSQPSWAPDTAPYIIFSDNLYSGVMYGGIKSMHITFEFYDVATNQPISFSGLNGELSFNSLNGNQGNDWNDPASSTEFAGDGRDDGVLSTNGSILSYHNQEDRGRWYMNNTYYGWNGDFSGDDDHLGTANFPKATVSFPLDGTSNDFTFGSAWGRAWNAFSSSAPFPVQQSAPTKTVEPADNNQGFDQRYDNDLDVYGLSEGGNWDFDKPQRGHNPDANDLNPGVLAKQDRFVDKGGSYYYYINQPTINLSTQGLVLPKGMEIDDTLPNGTKVDSLDDVTLFGLDGQVIEGQSNGGWPNWGNQSSSPFTAESGVNGQSLHLVLSDDAANKINEESKDKTMYGKDFTVRVKFHVTDDAPALMQNQATSKFTYDNGDYFNASSNKVDIQLRADPVDVSFTKYDSVTGDALKGATFTLYRNGEFQQNAISDDAGQVKFTKIAPGSDYKIEETQVPANYADPYKGQDLDVEITKDGKINWPDGVAENNRYPDTPTQKHFILHLDKVNADNAHALIGAEFKLTRLNASGDTDAEETVTTTDSGVDFKMAMDPGTYELKETKAPDKFDQLKGTFTFKINAAGEPERVSDDQFKFADGDTHVSDINDKDSAYQISYDGDDLPFNKNYGLKEADVSGTTGKLQVTIPDKLTPIPPVPDEVRLPKTGGNGFLPYLIGAAVLVVLALIVGFGFRGRKH